MRFVVDARFTPDADPQPRLEDEKRRVAELRDEGFIELLFRRIDGTGAYLVVTAESEAAARERLDTLPFVEIAIMTMALDEVEQH